MVNPTGPNGRPQITWVNIIATIALFTTLCGGGWLLFQNQFATLERQFLTNDKNLADQINEIRGDIRFLKGDEVSRNEYKELVKRLDGDINVVKDQLRVLETTRPTTGELQAVGGTNKDQIFELKERVRSLEDYLRRAQPLAPQHQN